MALRKMTNAQLDLRNDDDKEIEKKLTQNRSEHALEFEARIKRLEEEKETHKKPIQKKAEELGFKTKKQEPVSTTSLPQQLSQTEDELKKQIDELKLKLAITKNKNKVNSEAIKEELSDEVEKTEENKAAEIPNEEPLVVAAPKPIKRPTKKLKFPDGFLWGTATSAYQIEGGIKNNWSMWERRQAMTKKFLKSGNKKKDFICGDACDSYNRYEEDLDLAKKLNNNAIRLGIEWARLQPKRNTWDVEAIEHYRQVLAAAKKRGLTTFVTLWHWTIPTWFATVDAWEKKENIADFLKYVDLAVKEFGAYVDYWTTLNEPMMYVFGGYLKGYHPPGQRKPRLANKVMKNLVEAHNQSYKLIKKHFPQAPVSFVAMLNYFEPADKWNLVEVALAKFLHYYYNFRFFKKTTPNYDYIGVNYYFHDRIVWYPPFKQNEKKWVSDKGWEIYPEGIYYVLKFASKFKKPIYITENGLADAADKNRARFINEHLRFVHLAIGEGADVRGYFHWSLLDNFEWSFGWKMKFGLYEMNRETFKRKARPSARVYAKIAKRNEVEVEI